ncbi:DUF378 domain-containing protein [Thermohalobacter berrensis]|uniref:DUF378 domain-containing protein n=1 Tax=Thermohalobacter berrensis TaxID=99594 RepID=A0A419T270_9FIRM|nr:DUF378 domain-containing protein [Thermohalobacter berrensis]RKD31565.1 DUF378 domain-containing protein [Thermohalobacter berrensis]
MSILKTIVSILILLGAINWGLVGLFNFDLIEFIFKSKTSLGARIAYTLIGLSGIFTILYLIF